MVNEDCSNLPKYSFICTRHSGDSKQLNLVLQKDRGTWTVGAESSMQLSVPFPFCWQPWQLLQ